MNASDPADSLYHETWRPQFHFTAAKNWLNDPNGMVYFNGTYHLFFQYNPWARESDHKSWGHATSPDMVHWTQGPTVLFPDALGDMWSGSAVVDTHNTSGFGDGKIPPIVLIYCCAGGVSPASRGKDFTQCIAYSSDGGVTWKKYDANPVIPHIKGGNRDPKVIWHEPTRQWIMALYLDGNDFALLSSPDLKHWKQFQTINIPDSSECPDFYPMKIDHEEKEAWIFTAANAKYLVGQFDGKQFKPEGDTNPIQSEFGRNFYAGQTFSDVPNGRRVQIAWMWNAVYPAMPFNQQMTFPTELTLHRTHDGLRLFRLPVREIESLHDASATRSNIPLNEPNAAGETLSELHGDLLDIDATIELGTSLRAGIRVAGQTIEFDKTRNQVSCLEQVAPLEPIDGKIQVRVLVDRTTIEVFANDGVVSLTNAFIPDPRTATMSPNIYADAADAKLVSCKAFTLKSAWPEHPAIPDDTKPANP